MMGCGAGGKIGQSAELRAEEAGSHCQVPGSGFLRAPLGGFGMPEPPAHLRSGRVGLTSRFYCVSFYTLDDSSSQNQRRNKVA